MSVIIQGGPFNPLEQDRILWVKDIEAKNASRVTVKRNGN